MHEIYQFVNHEVDNEIIPNLMQFLRIPNQSRNFDPEWESNGLIESACYFNMFWAAAQGLDNAKVHYFKEAGRTPCVVLTVDAPEAQAPTVLLYGHIDKQPPLTEQWSAGLHPYDPVMKNNRLYARGAGDDGYAFFASVSMIKALQAYKVQKHRFVLFFETDEESDSKDLEYFLDKAADLIGQPQLVICLDSGALDYDHFYATSTLRGIYNLNLKVSVTAFSVHSGDSSGIIPDSFRIARRLLEGIEDSNTGILSIEEFNTNIPQKDYNAAARLVQELGDKMDWKFPFLDGVEPTTPDRLQQYLNSTWRPQLTLIGMDGVPSTQNGGNVLRPYTTLGLSIRLPPNLDSQIVEKAVEKYFEETEIPYNAVVELETVTTGNGYVAKALDAEIQAKLSSGADKFFGDKGMLDFGVGGSIPFMDAISKRFKDSNLLVTGVMGPESNAHGPDEFLEVGYLKKLMCTLVYFFSNGLE